MHLRQGSNALDSSSPPERSSPVILSAAKDLAADRDSPSLRGVSPERSAGAQSLPLSEAQG